MAKKTLVSGEQISGTYSYRLSDEITGKNHVYFIKLIVDHKVQTKKIVRLN
ncbi:MAG: hypothetical protein IH946_07405 [Bacteroidetes bacterium]|nr:hypothetical protein [Bacteroidota bacterium]